MLRFETTAELVPVAIERDVVGSGLREGLPAGVMFVSTPSVGAKVASCDPGEQVKGLGKNRWQVDLATQPELSILLSAGAVGGLVLEDADSGERILEGAFWLEQLMAQGWRAGPHSEGLETATDGTFYPRFLLRKKWRHERQYRLRVSSPGYGRATVEDPQALTIQSSPTVVRMTREPMLALRIEDGQGDPYPHEVIVRADGIPFDLYRGKPSGGLVPPFSCSASDQLQVRVGPFADDYAVHFSAREALGSGDSLYTVRIPTGEILVRVEPNYLEEIKCRSKGGGDFDGARVDQETWSFRSIPEGRYAVGPEPVMRTASILQARGRNGYPIEVETGGLLVLDLSHLQSGEPRRGRLVCDGLEPQLLFVAPLFGDLDLPVSIGRADWRFPVDEAGMYEIPSLPLDPPRFYAAYLNDNGDPVSRRSR